tara:strand:+ start:4482 stop:5444 length:963 start_codon:yes stop_codon:yes gene_type:complete
MTPLQNNKQWNVRFNAESGRILGISPQPFKQVNDNEQVVSVTNNVCGELISGKKNMRRYAVHWDSIDDRWDIDVKSDTLVLEVKGNELNQFTEGTHPANSDVYVQVIRKENILRIKINLLTIRDSLNLGQINFIKNESPDILDLYVCRKNNPDYLVGIIPIDALELFNNRILHIDVPKNIVEHINSWDDISIFTKPVFKTYGIEFTDLSAESIQDHSKKHQISNSTLDAHINMYTLNDNLIIDNKIDENMIHYFNNKKYMQFHVSDSHIDNYVTTLNVSVANLLYDDKVRLDLPANWPANPVIAFAETQLAVNYIMEKEQ